MCNRYTPPRHLWAELGYVPDWTDRPEPRQLFADAMPSIGPKGRGIFMRWHPSKGLEQVVGVWGLIPHFEPSREIAYASNNCRSEEVDGKPAFRGAWRRGQRCIIPADEFWEPCWETGRNVWWRVERADRQPFALAGLWETWTDPQTGEIVESYTMLTINADGHSLMGRMHKPDPKLPQDQQDKRMVCVLEREDWDGWLRGSVEVARPLLRRAPAEIFVGTPEMPVGPVTMDLF